MPRKIIKKYLPNEQSLRNNPSLKWLAKYIQHPSLWHLNRKSVSRAFMVGIFCAFLPIPMQMLVAALLAILIRSNMVISVSLVWITNPITMPPIFYFTYKVGTYLLGSQALDDNISFTLEYITQQLSSIWLPLLSGSLFCAVIFGALSYLAINLFWIWHVRSSWRNRSKRIKKLKEK
ncbi:MAG: DUF2062 domain-containing protein [Oceanospirillaceae bacterium]|nr:DUF2062 domain-containing protein [Oceanospirillaceae bacterium]